MFAKNKLVYYCGIAYKHHVLMTGSLGLMKNLLQQKLSNHSSKVENNCFMVRYVVWVLDAHIFFRILGRQNK